MIEAVRAELTARANPAKAPDMQAYMKSEMPFLGVQKPARKEIAREVFATYPLEGSTPGGTPCCGCGARRPIARSATWP
jgi:DNA alkylation repair enzyme